MKFKSKKSVLFLSLGSLFVCHIALAQETETIIETQPQSTTTKSVIVSTPANTVSTPTTVTKETIISTPAGKEVIITPAPTAKEVVVAPTGYVHCFTVSSGWYNNEWIPQHQVCQYENSPEGTSWIEGYWACTQYKISEGICSNWDWRPGHWTKTLVVY